MLFVALTRSSISMILPGSLFRQFRASAKWLLTCATDDFLSRLSKTPDKIVAEESLLGSAENPDNDVSFIAACFSTALQTLRVTKSTVSGRPLYYHTNSSGEFFASTHIAMLRQAGVAVEEDAEAIPELLVYRTIAPPRTMYRGVRQLRAAGSIVVTLEDGNVKVSDALGGYDPADSKDTGSEVEIVGSVVDVLAHTMDKLTPVAPRVATLLSGGLDSSILSVLARSRLSIQDTYSTSYPFDEFETNFEQQYALSAAHALSMRHTLFVPAAIDFMTGFVEALAAAEAPLNHLQSILLHLLFKHSMPDHVNRVICGEAADSAFGLDMHLALHGPTSISRSFFSLSPIYLGLQAIGLHWARAESVAQQIAQIRGSRCPILDSRNPIWSYAAYGDFQWVGDHYGASREQVIAARCEQLQSVANRPFNDALAIYALNYCDVVTTTSVWSKLAEGQRKIVYYPFASENVLNVAFSIPWEAKLKTGKHLLRGVGRRVGIPEFILTRQKQSFGIISKHWAEKGGPLEPLVAVAAKVVDIRQLRNLQGDEPHRAMTLWSLLNYAVLKRLFVMGESKASLMEEVIQNHSSQLSTPVSGWPRRW
jgi:asparagine synthetase B (glutamine-hydrolysing)